MGGRGVLPSTTQRGGKRQREQKRTEDREEGETGEDRERRRQREEETERGGDRERGEAAEEMEDEAYVLAVSRSSGEERGEGRGGVRRRRRRAGRSCLEEKPNFRRTPVAKRKKALQPWTLRGEKHPSP